jgi:hypothetical protein
MAGRVFRFVTRFVSWRFVSRRFVFWGFVTLAAALPAFSACNTHRLVVPVPRLSGGADDLYQRVVSRDIDILFMVDDSSSMAPLQSKLTASFPTFMNVLKALPGGLPNVHIGVVSSSMGAGRDPSIDHCARGGDRGVFRAAPLGATCGVGSLAPGQYFISSVNGITNYTGDIADVFSCIAALGDGGCGFEHQLASVLRALGADGQPPPGENAGFLRPDAFLMVVLITNEDDCSAPPDSALFDSTSALISDPLGPLQSYRCNEFGHVCGGHAPPRTPTGPTDLTGTCRSAEDGRLLRVADAVAALKQLKADPSKVLVAAIAGPPDPYVVDLAPPALPDVTMWPVIAHSCTSNEADGSVTYGDPSVRIAAWVDAFGGNGMFQTICGDTFRAALVRIAENSRHYLAPCIDGTVLDTSGALWTGGTTPDCSVIDHAPNLDGTIVGQALPACAPGQNAGPTACWYLEANPPVCPRGPVINFNRPGGQVPLDLNSSVSCAVLVCPPKGAPGAPAGC